MCRQPKNATEQPNMASNTAITLPLRNSFIFQLYEAGEWVFAD
jgi:hypothetical protein